MPLASVLAAFFFTVLGLLYDAAPMVAIGAAALAWAGLATLARLLYSPRNSRCPNPDHRTTCRARASLRIAVEATR